jgi:hypothetical protein
MAKGNRSSKPFNSLFQGIYRFFRKGKQTIKLWLQGWVIKVKRRSRNSQAGFVLPTVTMVLLVVVLLSLAITFRAFDRAKDARYTKVSEAAFNAAAPALDRAKAKVTQALQEVSQISDEEIYSILRTYTFGDETQVQVRYDIDDNKSIDLDGADGDSKTLKDNEAIETAWRFPFDTDNNGKFDSFSIYGIFFRTPTPGEVRTPLDARSLPLPDQGISGQQECAFYSGGVDSLVTDEGLTPNRGKFKKSIFAYTVTVPIDENTAQDLGNDFEANTGSPAFSPLEYQQDWQIKPLNGVVYLDDLEISPGPEFNLNVGLYAESNLIASPFKNNIRIYQISGKNSCFYDADLSKVVVGGNVINGMLFSSTQENPVKVDLFQGAEADIKTVEISKTNQSTGDGAFKAAYNDRAYSRRLDHLVQYQIENGGTDPTTVQKLVTQLVNEEGLTEEKARRQELKRYFKARLRKVPIAEVDIGEEEALQNPVGSGDTLAPPDDWATRPNDVGLKDDQLEASKPNDEDQQTGVENYLGDRVLVGNNQPALEYSEAEGTWVIASEQRGNWTGTEEPRDRLSRVEVLPDAVDKKRGGFWERAAAKLPRTYIEGVGGLRVVTGGGVYDRGLSFLPPPSADAANRTYDDPATTAVEEFPIVWPDTMPMSPEVGEIPYDNAANAWAAAALTTLPTGNAQYARGDLRMRATAVYHYAQDAIDPINNDNDQTPLACVSSYYDNSSSLTAENETGLPWHATADGRSNNGIVYPPPETGRPGQSTKGANGLLSGGGNADLEAQANYVFPDGRFANQLLREALRKPEADRDIADLAAIDAELCAIDIRDGNINPEATPVIPHGAIREVALLDGRQVKAVDADDDTTAVDETFTLSSTLAEPAKLSSQYDLALEDRQPLEVRATLLDLNQLRNTTIANITATDIDELSEEYILPLSGIVYATRDDALPDRSDRTAKDDNSDINEETSAALSPVDYQLDPTRRPNGILLVNGDSLGRNDNAAADTEADVLKEKGLTLVSNLPVYIQGTFNFHDQEEFTQKLDNDFGNFYDRQDLNPDFACREGDPIRASLNYACDNGDNWRPATILADAVTLLSKNFRYGFRNEGDFDLRNNAGTTVPGNTIAIGYDFTIPTNGIDATDPTVNETTYGIDLDGSGTAGDNTAVKETEVTAKAARQLNGFNAYNDFGVNGLSSNVNFKPFDSNTDDVIDSTDGDKAFTDENYRNNTKTDQTAADSTYFNNFVTPIQRRGEFSEYVMEVCPKLPVSACGPQDWQIIIDDGTTAGEFDAGDTILKPNTPAGYVDITDDTTYQQNDLLAGTTAKEPSADLQRFPRRVAFLRNDSYELVLDKTGLPVPIGIDGTSNSAQCYAANDSASSNNDKFLIEAGPPQVNATCNVGGLPRTQGNALWFQTNDGGDNWGYNHRLWYYDPGPGTEKTFTATVQQPLLVPVLQLHEPIAQPQANQGGFPEATTLVGKGDKTRWLPRPAENTEYNLVLGAGDVPGRPNETNGGLQNLARVLENWGDPTQYTTKIYGSFVQPGRSEYATAPYISLQGNVKLFGQNKKYASNNANKQISYFQPPGRNWGFDVGLLAQPPDYFSRTFARLEKDQEGNYKIQQLFREVSKDDPWVKGLLCGKVDGDNAVPDTIRNPLNCDQETNRTNKYDDQ